MEQTKLNEEAVNDIAKVFWNTIDDPRLLTSQDMCRKFLKSYLSHPEALRSIIEQSVKPLEFKPHKRDDGVRMQLAKTSVGRYAILMPYSSLIKGFRASYDARTFDGYSEELGEFDTLEDAIAACQRHHTEQVLKLFNLGGDDAKTTKQAGSG